MVRTNVRPIENLAPLTDDGERILPALVAIQLEQPTGSSVFDRPRDGIQEAEFACSLLEIEGKKLGIPKRFPPATDSLDYHRT